MSPKGQTGTSRQVVKCTDAELKLVYALRQVYSLLGSITQSQVGLMVHCGGPTVRQYMSLQRLPTPAFIRGLYEEAVSAVGDETGMPVRLDDLLAQRDEVGRAQWSARNSGRQRRAAAPDPTAPVLRSSQLDSEWDGVDDVQRLLADGRPQDAAVLLAHTGFSLAPEKVQRATAACRAIGLNDAAEAILRSASRRTPESLLQVVAALARASQHGDVVVALRGVNSLPGAPRHVAPAVGATGTDDVIKGGESGGSSSHSRPEPTEATKNVGAAGRKEKDRRTGDGTARSRTVEERVPQNVDFIGVIPGTDRLCCPKCERDECLDFHDTVDGEKYQLRIQRLGADRGSVLSGPIDCSDCIDEGGGYYDLPPGMILMAQVA
jgi:hypothetical protein